MSPHRARYVTACQQLLALAVVLAVLTPAASIVTLDVVDSGPAGGAGALALHARTPSGSSAARGRVPARLEPGSRHAGLSRPGLGGYDLAG